MTTKSPQSMAKVVRQRANHRCEYCRASEWLTGQRHHIDHIIPRVHSGPTTLENLCLACAACNGSKQDKVEAADPESAELTPLFNPRTDKWHEHFAWSQDGLRVIGLTATGRATVQTLKMNRPLALSARAVWVSVQRHPPKD